MNSGVGIFSLASDRGNEKAKRFMANSLNICVVDDDRDVAMGLAEILEMVGHEVHTVFSGQDALRVLAEQDFDIAFINAELPELTDLESFIEVRKAKPGMKAVMMTGYTIEQLLRQAAGGGAVSVLSKPVTMDEVVRALDGAKPKGIVLVAEDDPEIAEKIRDTLKLQEHRVGIAHTPGEALVTVSAGNSDILMLDMLLPVIDALEVYLEIEKQGHSLPTIVISTYPDKEGGPIDVLRDQTVTGVLVKPFDPARLLTALDKMQKRGVAVAAEEDSGEPDRVKDQGGRILVIDDDQDVAEGLADVLTDLGHTVEIALTGSKALETAERFDAQIALIDIKLGRTSGLELIASLEKLRPGIVNVVITANAGKESVIASMRSGAFDFLNKPTHPQDLFAVLDRCFERIEAQDDRTEDGPSSDLSANVGHELRDPLNAVIGFSEILGDEMLGPLGSEQYVHYAKGINEAGQHLTSIIDDLFEPSPGESGSPVPSEPQPEPPTSEEAESKQTRPHEAEAGDTEAETPASAEPETAELQPFAPQPSEPDFAGPSTEQQETRDDGPGGPETGEADEPVVREPEMDEWHLYEPSSGRPASQRPDIAEPFGDRFDAHTAGAGEPETVETRGEGPAARDQETYEPDIHQSPLSELYSDRPDIAELLAETPEARETDPGESEPADPGPAEPDWPEPDVTRPEPFEPLPRDPSPPAAFADDSALEEPGPFGPGPDAAGSAEATPEESMLEAMDRRLLDSREADSTEPDRDEPDMGRPEPSTPQWEPQWDETDLDMPLFDQPEVDDTQAAALAPAESGPAEPQAQIPDPREAASEDAAMEQPRDPLSDEPQARGQHKEDEEEEEDPEQAETEQADKIVRFDPFRKVI
jgi:DNA-binding NtrC family response regulator